MKEYFDESENIDMTKQLVESKLSYIEQVALSEIKKYGKDYSVKGIDRNVPFFNKIIWRCYIAGG